MRTEMMSLARYVALGAIGSEFFSWMDDLALIVRCWPRLISNGDEHLGDNFARRGGASMRQTLFDGRASFWQRSSA